MPCVQLAQFIMCAHKKKNIRSPKKKDWLEHENNMDVFYPAAGGIVSAAAAPEVVALFGAARKALGLRPLLLLVPPSVVTAPPAILTVVAVADAVVVGTADTVSCSWDIGRDDRRVYPRDEYPGDVGVIDGE